MKQLFSRSLVYVGHQRPRVTWLAVLPLAMSLMLAFTALNTSPALAATNLHTTAHRLSVSITSTVSTALQDSAGDPCKTDTALVDLIENGISVAWLKMQTRWCYNFVTVTSHSTILSWGTTGPGAALGWLAQTRRQYSFNCYVASGSTRNCSGNHEHAAQFYLELGPDGTVGGELQVNESENYLGQAFNNTSQKFCNTVC